MCPRSIAHTSALGRAVEGPWRLIPHHPPQPLAEQEVGQLARDRAGVESELKRVLAIAGLCLRQQPLAILCVDCCHIHTRRPTAVVCDPVLVEREVQTPTQYALPLTVPCLSWVVPQNPHANTI
jgi:hypothetical protein